MTSINIHNIAEITENITHFTQGIKFVCRNIEIKTITGECYKISLFTEHDERAIKPLTEKRIYKND